MSAVCEHVPYEAATALGVGQMRPLRQRDDWVRVHCPCCGLGGWRAPDDDLTGDDCPYCGVQSVHSDEEAL